MILKDLDGKIRRFIKGRIAGMSGKKSITGIPNNCLHLYPVEKTDPVKLAVLFSGDGGWARLTNQLSTHLREAGIAVVGIDCMHYFWARKTPAQTAEDLASAIDHFSQIWGTRELVLLGYSMGADVLPQIIRELPLSIRTGLSHVVLMSPGHYGCLKFRFIGWLGYETPARLGVPLRPDIEALAPISVSCFAGETETTSQALHLKEVVDHVEFLPGGHHYAGDYSTLAKCILRQINKNLPPCPAIVS